MTRDELFKLAETARNEAIAKAMKDKAIWRDQVLVVLTGLMKFASVHMAMIMALISGGLDSASATLISLMVVTGLSCANPWNFFHRSLFHEAGDAAFDAVVEQHRKES